MKSIGVKVSRAYNVEQPDVITIPVTQNSSAQGVIRGGKSYIVQASDNVNILKDDVSVSFPYKTDYNPITVICNNSDIGWIKVSNKQDITHLTVPSIGINDDIIALPNLTNINVRNALCNFSFDNLVSSIKNVSVIESTKVSGNLKNIVSENIGNTLYLDGTSVSGNINSLACSNNLTDIRLQNTFVEGEITELLNYYAKNRNSGTLKLYIYGSRIKYNGYHVYDYKMKNFCITVTFDGQGGYITDYKSS